MREELLVLAKTYPTISRKYGPLVCVAGITSDGEWRRIYPIPWNIFWKYSETKFKKKQWIRYTLESNKRSDRRPESRKINFRSIEVLHEESFRKIKQMLDERLTSLEDLRQFKDHQVSLGVIKPKIMKLVWEDWDSTKELEEYQKTQKTLNDSKPIPIILPDKKFKYVFKCSESCPSHSIMCEDWEIGILYLKK